MKGQRGGSSKSTKPSSRLAKSAAIRAPKKTSSKEKLAPLVTFEYFDPAATKVCVAGSFNSWTADTQLKKDKSGRWSVSVPLAPGSYEYRFLVDGAWQNDQRPTACVPNPFGTYNCVIHVNNSKQ